MTTVLIDGNFYLHRAFNMSASKRRLDHLKKNTLTLFLSMVCSDLRTLKATHALVCFDSPVLFRHKIYKQYKANRRKGGSEVVRFDGERVSLKESPGAFVRAACKVVKLSGLTHAQEDGYEGDDLLGAASKCLPGKVIICTRDKDADVLVTERVSIYWPIEKKMRTLQDVRKTLGIEPEQVRDYLCLLGDGVDNIPGVPDIGPVTARKLLNEHGSIGKALKDPKWRSKLLPHKKTLILAKQLVTLRTDIKFKHSSLAIGDVSDELGQHVWDVPKSLKALGDMRKLQTMKGLFG